MQGLLNCGKANLLLGCLEVSLEDIIHRAGPSLRALFPLQTDVRPAAHIHCNAAVLGAVPLEDAAIQMQKVLALSSKLGKLLLRTTSKASPTDDNQVEAELDPGCLPVCG